jgi:WXG100 family type VII secretion target
MTTPFTVTPQELMTAASNIKNANSTLQGQIQQVQTLVNGLIDSGYQGPCANQLVSVSSEWNTDAVNLNTALLEIAANLTTSANNYSGTEGQNTNNLSAVGDPLLSAGNF